MVHNRTKMVRVSSYDEIICNWKVLVSIYLKFKDIYMKILKVVKT